MIRMIIGGLLLGYFALAFCLIGLFTVGIVDLKLSEPYLSWSRPFYALVSLTSHVVLFGIPGLLLFLFGRRARLKATGKWEGQPKAGLFDGLGAVFRKPFRREPSRVVDDRPSDARFGKWAALADLFKEPNVLLILDGPKVLAERTGNFVGWELLTGYGKTTDSRGLVPRVGSFVFVAVDFQWEAATDYRLKDITAYKLNSLRALESTGTSVDRDDKAILFAVEGPASLTPAQKQAVRRMIEVKVRPYMLKGAERVLKKLE